jgi:hypothetical protein
MIIVESPPPNLDNPGEIWLKGIQTMHQPRFPRSAHDDHYKASGTKTDSFSFKIESYCKPD